MPCFWSQHWYLCRFRQEDLFEITDPVEALDVSLLQNLLLEPILGITDPRTDERIDFVGGIRGLSELERRCRTDMSGGFCPLSHIHSGALCRGGRGPADAAQIHLV